VLRIRGLSRPDEPGAYASHEDRLRVGNIMARVRMIVAFDHARRLGALVVGTENKTEHYLGYYTRFGDEASDLEPIRSLYKGEVVALARWLSVPESVLSATPTAGLWQGQTDEGELGFSYALADEVLQARVEPGHGRGREPAPGIAPDQLAALEAWLARVEFKHHLPYIGPEPVLNSGRP
jgi:NAD+ synthase